MNIIIKPSTSKGISYREYIDLINNLVVLNQTTGDEQSAERIGFTKLNASRMRRLDKTIILSDSALTTIKEIAKKQTWLVLLESWCADAAQTLPILNKIAESSPLINLKIIFRDDNKELMDLVLTNGTRSIPKILLLDESGNVMTTWGPRSKVASQMVVDYKKEHGKIDDFFKESLQVWYNKDKGKAIIDEFIELALLELEEHGKSN
ncbi:thioredoxin family protein [Maribacter hydrothermalis]|uniref:Thioredoxin n=1 Tax=Maribacter hydrothermalis TaxID=1836467 RepID=A0A1B7YXH8_9FLAO|nr:thioredoxin family protein [Maribacter hydrothermalis]APQ16765.1 thioredoxin family protein [Maribacter hydrothermalis]OBR35192.1 thioredoxin [Maribacter hydrothermalis]